MKKFMTTLMIAFGILFISIQASAGDVLRFATEAAYPPFNMRAADGSIEGFEIELGMAMCAKINRECEFVAQEWDGMIPGLLAKKFDGIFASMAITEPRKKKINFTKKYYSTPGVFVAKKTNKIDFNDETLGGITVGTIPGTFECYLDKKYPKVNRRTYKNAENLYLDLDVDRLDAIFIDSVQVDFGLLKTERGQNMIMVGDPADDKECFGEGIGIGVRKSDDKLREQLNQAIDMVRADGTYQKIMEKYFDYDIFGK